MTTVSPAKDERDRARVDFAWTATEGYRHFPPYVNISGNRIVVRGQERDNGEYYEHGDYVAIELPDDAMAELRAAMSPVDRLREALERAEALIDLSEQATIAERKAQYGSAYTGAQEAAIRQTHRQQLKGVRILAAALSSPEPMGEANE